MTASAQTTDPRLPPELERQIFELTARCDARSHFPLLLVAHRVRSWLEPLLYQVLDFTDRSYTGLTHALKYKPPDFLSENTHSIHWAVQVSASKGIQLPLRTLQELTNLHSFTTRGTGLLGPSVPSLLSLRLRRLALGRADTIQLLFRISNLLPKELQEFQLLNTLTHLHVPFFLELPSTVCLIPTLTHISFIPYDIQYCGLSKAQILETLLSSEQTAAIVFRVFTDRENGSDLATKAFLERNGLRDERIVMIPEVMLVIGKSADVKEDIWRRAEKMIASKRKPAESSVDSIQKFLDSAKI